MAQSSNTLPAGGPGRFILKYLLDNENEAGATVSGVVQQLKEQPVARGLQPDELRATVETFLKCGTELGYLERKGSKFIHALAKGLRCGGRRRRRRRRSRCRRRRRRCSRRRRRGCSRRRRRSCSRRRRRSCSRRRRRSCSRRRRRSCRRRRHY